MRHPCKPSACMVLFSKYFVADLRGWEFPLQCSRVVLNSKNFFFSPFEIYYTDSKVLRLLSESQLKPRFSTLELESVYYILMYKLFVLVPQYLLCWLKFLGNISGAVRKNVLELRGISSLYIIFWGTKRFAYPALCKLLQKDLVEVDLHGLPGIRSVLVHESLLSRLGKIKVFRTVNKLHL